MKQRRTKERYIADLLKANPDWNFLSFVITPWQANGVDATIKLMKKRGMDPKGVICILKHPITGKCVDENSFLCECNDVGLVFWDDPSNGELTVGISKIFNRIVEEISAAYYIMRFKNGEPVYFVSFNDINQAMIRYICRYTSRKVVFVDTDDGAGSYTGTMELKYLHDLNKGKLYAYRNQLMRRIKNSMDGILQSLEKKHGMYIDHLLLHRDANGKMNSNSELIAFYKEVMKEKTAEIPDDIRNLIDGKIILATDSFEDNKMSVGQEDERIYDGLYNALVKAGLSDLVLIKPHPREVNFKKYEKYGWEILPKIYSIESFFGNDNIRPVAVISICSSSMISLKLFYDVCTISLAKKMLAFQENTGLVSTVEKYLRLVDGIVQCPDTWEEMLEILRSERKNRPHHHSVDSGQSGSGIDST